MRTPSTRSILPLAAIWALLLPAAASAEYLVPPGNSAATQYTETVPTAGGQRNAEKDRRNGGSSPSDVLGKDNARQLDEEGEAGREVAEFAAETAPAVETEEPPSPSEGNGAGKRGEPKSKGGEREDESATTAGTPGGGNSAGSGGSGLGEVLGQATGWSSSDALLLLALLGAIAWAVAFLRRQGDRPTA